MCDGDCCQTRWRLLSVVSRSSLAVRDCPRPPRPDSVLPRHFEVDVTERLSMAVGSKYEDIMAEVVRDKRTLARV
jgi:hypothetical protein